MYRKRRECRMDTHRMTDIHMHLIPGVDDGSFSAEMSMSMLFMAYRQGVRAVFATPHSPAFLRDRDFVLDQFASLKEQAEKLPFDMRLYLGCEVRCEPHAMEQTLERLAGGIFPSINGTRYVLTEFSTGVQPPDALQMASQMRAAGWIPIIAHAERYPALSDGGTAEKMLDLGCLFQVNAYSLEEEAEEAAAKRARRLLQEGKVSFFGSDAHRMNHRPPSVEGGLRYLYRNCRREYADAVAFGNAEKYLYQMEE